MWGRKIAVSIFVAGLFAGIAATEASASYENGAGDHRKFSARKIGRKAGKLPPFAFIQMCVKHPGLCQDRPGRLVKAAGKVRMTASLHAQLANVNTAVNRQIEPVRDSKTDSWNVNVSRGDCEDYVLTKKARLLAGGWPSSALSIAVVRTRSGDKHAVLVVDTASGSYVLDNLNRNVVPISRAPYRFLTMQSSGSSRKWQRL